LLMPRDPANARSPVLAFRNRDARRCLPGPGLEILLTELAAPALFAAGVLDCLLGEGAVLYAVAAARLGVAPRAVDLEGCALSLPGGSLRAAKRAFGSPVSTFTASALLLNHSLFALRGTLL
jgi:hypothetical protein